MNARWSRRPSASSTRRARAQAAATGTRRVAAVAAQTSEKRRGRPSWAALLAAAFAGAAFAVIDASEGGGQSGTDPLSGSLHSLPLTPNGEGASEHSERAPAPLRDADAPKGARSSHELDAA